MLKVKICGITNIDDALLAAELGADAIGFIFAPSPRRISPDTARDIIENIPAFVKSVGVFVNEDPEVISNIVKTCGIDMVQLHGDESPELCYQFMPRTIKALRIKDYPYMNVINAYKGKVRALLLDAYSEKSAGGTGKSFNWAIALKIKESGIPVILAGGLGPENIQSAITTVKPYGVDVNSGIEERPGKKSHDLMRELFRKINKRQ